MSRSRQFAFASLGIVAVGVAVAVGALAFSSTKGLGPLPAEALSLPAEAPFMAGIDVRRLVASEFYKRQMAARGEAHPDAFRELEEKTGLDPERDVDQIVIAGGKGGVGPAGIVFVVGSFDEYKLSRAIEAKPGVTWEKREGATLYQFGDAGKAARALAFLDAHTLVLGATPLVNATLENRSRGASPLLAKSALKALLERVKPGSTFWVVGDQSVLANLPASFPAPGAAAGSGATLTLPALESLIVTGDVEPLVALSATGDTADEKAARDLADVVRGFVALASLSAKQNPQLQQLAQAVSVTTSAKQVEVSLRIAPELLESLASMARAGSTPPAPLR
jgi:hypothetical protein